MTAAPNSPAVATAQIMPAISQGTPLYRPPGFRCVPVAAHTVREGDVVADELSGAPLAVIAVGARDGTVWLYTRPADNLDGAATRKHRFRPDAVVRRAVHPGPGRTTAP